MATPAKQLFETMQDSETDDESDQEDTPRNAGSGPSSRFTESVKKRAEHEAQQQTAVVKEELGRRAFDLLEEYFPEEAKTRRRRGQAQTLAVGVLVGVFIRHLLGR